MEFKWNEMQWKNDLAKDIRTEDESFNWNENVDIIPGLRKYLSGPEVTDCNRNSVTEHFLKVKDNCKAILEIGICRNNENSITHCFLNNKKDETIYVGIDLDDKSFLDNPDKNIYTIKNTSSDVESNMEKMKSWGVTEFDFIFIDGQHSVNQVLVDWEYTKWLSDSGIVGLHDTNEHPGPYLFVRAMDTNKWEVVYDICPNDWGIGFAWKK